MKRFKALLSIMLVLCVSMSLLAGCGAGKENTAKQSADTAGTTTEKSTAAEQTKPAEPVELVAYGSFFDQPLSKSLKEMYMGENPNVTIKVLDSKAEGNADTLKILLAGGQQIDVTSLDNPLIMRALAESSLIPLDELAQKYNFNFEDAYGPSGAEQCKYNGKEVMVSTTKTTWFLLYNKKIFDDAKIPYPSADKSMTWTEYRELAKKLTKGEGANKIYGALSLDWPMFYYDQAIQELGGGDKFYTADGKSNIEDPAFAKSFKLWTDMTNVDKSMPDMLTIISRKFPYTEFLSGKYAMHPYGSWVFGLLKDKNQFPRDWQVGIAPIPVPEGVENTITWGVYAGFGIPTTAKNTDEAFKFMKYAAEKAPGVSDSEITSYIKGDNSALSAKLASGLENEGITADLLQKVLFNPAAKSVTEKLTGPASVEYDSILEEEFHKYASKGEDLDTMIKNVKTRADKAIADSKK